MKSKISISYIILHYKTIEETLECLTCLSKIADASSHYIVVDNHTLSKEEEKQIRKYTEDILKLDQNYGFAKANNKGIQYAKEKYHSKYYVVINNDVLITQEDFELKIKETDQKYHFDLLGPKIESPSGESVNPFPAFSTKEAVLKELKKSDQLIKIYQNSFFYFLLKLYLDFKYIFKERPVMKNGDGVLKNVPIHGCAIIFSKKYVEKYDYPFYNETFLFHEEEFLYQRVQKDHLICIYNPELEVYHKEGSSVRKSMQSERKSKLFKEKERKKSLELLLKQM